MRVSTILLVVSVGLIVLLGASSQVDRHAGAAPETWVYLPVVMNGYDPTLPTPTPTATTTPTCGITWRARASMPTARYGLGVAAAKNGKVYAIGGHTSFYSPYAKTRIVEEYDPVTDIWTRKADMPTARSHFGVAAAPSGLIYAIGGASTSTLDVVEEYAPETDTWWSVASLLSSRSALAAASTSNGKVYAVGGTYWFQALDAVEEYDPLWPYSWSRRTRIPTGRFGHGLAGVPSGRLYAIGGYGGSGLLSSVEEFDPSAYNPSTGTMGVWRAVRPMPTARWRLGVATGANGRVYAVGGDDGRFGLSVVEEYNPATDTWVTCTPLPTPRYRLGLVATPDGKLYAIGGVIGNRVLATVEEGTFPR